MAHMNAVSPAAAAYAQALLELAPDIATGEQLMTELDELRRLVKEDALFRSFLLDPSIATHRRGEVLNRAFDGRSSQLLVNFMGVLNEKNRCGLLPEIAVAFREMLDAKENRVRVQVTVAQQLDEQQMTDVRDRVSTALGKTAIVEQKIDDTIIGGLVLRVQDKIMDTSVKAQLEAMRKQLVASRERLV